MEASTAAPAAADGSQPVAPTPAGPAGAPPLSPTEGTQEAQPQAPEQPVEDNLQAQLDQMQRRAEAAEARLGNQPAPPESDFLTALTGAEQDLGISPEDLAAMQAGQQPEQVSPEEQQQQLKELDDYFDQKWDEKMAPREEAEQIKAAQAWTTEHKDVAIGTPLGDEMLATMEGLANRYGQQAALDPQMLDFAYTHVKARQADAGAVPAGQAANHGASIETQAGQTQTGEDSVEDKYIRDLTAGANKRSAFD